MENKSEWEIEKETIKRVVDECADKIAEHVDAVQIIVTHHSHDEGNTMSYEKGNGNMHARLGVITEWVQIQRQYAKNWAIRKDGDDGEPQGSG